SEREFLAWLSELETARRAWQAAPDGTKNDAVLMGLALAQAQNWLEKRADDLPQAVREFVMRSGEVDSKRREAAQQLEYRRIKADEELARLRAEKEAREQRERADAEARARQVEHRRVRRLRSLVGVLVFALGVAMVAFWNSQWLKEQGYRLLY